MGKDLKSLTITAIERLVIGLGQPRYQAGHIFSAIQARGVTDISAITTLSKPLRTKLIEDGYYISSLRLVEKLTDPDGTEKYVFGLLDGGRIESVLLSSCVPGAASCDDLRGTQNAGRRTRPPRFASQSEAGGANRRTLCVSTQVGCGMGCVFCATGRLGLARSLTAGEIVDQVNVIAGCRLPIANLFPIENRKSKIENQKQKRAERITNVVFMGMGEPLANYEATLDAVRILNHPAGRHIGIRHLTLSTCGLADAIERLADEDIQPRLAISLNAPTDAIRQKLMPIAKKYSLGRLFEAVELYQRKTRNRVTFEYCLIKGVNDTSLHAQMLIRRLRGLMCNVNLIEYNPSPQLRFAKQSGGGNLKPSGRKAIERFAGVLKDAGIETTVRLKMGQTINAACGQLGAERTENLE